MELINGEYTIWRSQNKEAHGTVHSCVLIAAGIKACRIFVCVCSLNREACVKFVGYQPFYMLDLAQTGSIAAVRQRTGKGCLIYPEKSH